MPSGALEADPRHHVQDVVARSGSSFTAGMRVLPKARREAMYAIYAFCREVDDIADEPDSLENKRAGLAGWREEIERLYAGTPTYPTGRALLAPVRDFDLPKEEFLALIDGMEADAEGTLLAPDWEDFILYCRRVAGAVGLLSIRAFGTTEDCAEEMAIVLGEALQMTNILRDIDDDATEGRLYLPRNLLEGAGIEITEAAGVAADPALPRACAALARVARDRFARAAVLLSGMDRRTVRPCLLMMEVYRRTLDRLEARGWQAPRAPVSVPKAEKLWIVLRHGLL